MKNLLLNLWIAFCVFIMVCILSGSIKTMKSEGPSMTPSNESVVGFNIGTNFPWEEIHRGDIVSVQFPGNDIGSMKRVIGLPGDTLFTEDGVHFYINGNFLEEDYLEGIEATPYMIQKYGGKTWVLGNNEYFAAGDNRNNSKDSRIFGVVTKDDIDCIVRLKWTVKKTPV